ncbi:MAG: hypothetical protein JRN52_08495 [Nitrososphaerota archaeon]|nr:hypothetical protein [Nitrososphaerota archaeon]
MPKRSYCKYCYGDRNVYYLHDDVVSGSKQFGVMMVCSRCTAHLMPMEVSLSESELQSLAGSPTKIHEHGIFSLGGVTEHIVNRLPVIPYGFDQDGNPIHPTRDVLHGDIFFAIKQLGVVPARRIRTLKERQIEEEVLIQIYRKARAFRMELDKLSDTSSRVSKDSLRAGG